MKNIFEKHFVLQYQTRTLKPFDIIIASVFCLTTEKKPLS